jgi:hypothetical protein
MVIIGEVTVFLLMMVVSWEVIVSKNIKGSTAPGLMTATTSDTRG